MILFWWCTLRTVTFYQKVKRLLYILLGGPVSCCRDRRDVEDSQTPANRLY